MGKSTSQTTQQQSSTSAPWSLQQPYLETAFSGAQDALTKAQGAATPDGFTAQFTPDQLAVFQKMIGYGTGNDGLSSSTGAAGTALNTAGANSTTNGLYGLQNFTPQGGTDSNIAAATAYANNPAIPGMVNAAMRDVNRNATENILPAIGRNAAGTGNINSNRPDIAAGIVQRGVNDQAGDISANLRGTAYDSGLKLAEQNSEATNASMLAKMTGMVGGGNNAVSTGAGANTSAVGQQGGLFDIAGGGVTGQNTASQANLTNQNQAWQFGTDSPFAALNNYYNIVGSNSWGGQTTGSSTGTSTPSFWQTLGGLMSAGAQGGKAVASFA